MTRDELKSLIREYVEEGFEINRLYNEYLSIDESTIILQESILSKAVYKLNSFLARLVEKLYWAIEKAPDNKAKSIFQKILAGVHALLLKSKHITTEDMFRAVAISGNELAKSFGKAMEDLNWDVNVPEFDIDGFDFE